MPRNRRLLEAHFVCRNRRQVVDRNDGTFLTNWWVINPEHIYEGLVVALHETRTRRSYLQGVVAEFRVREESIAGRRQRRVEFLVRKTPLSLPWGGDGSGEKGFVWE